MAGTLDRTAREILGGSDHGGREAHHGVTISWRGRFVVSVRPSRVDFLIEAAADSTVAPFP